MTGASPEHVMHTPLFSRRQALAVLAAAAAGAPAWAQAPRPAGWPARPVRVVVPATAGGQTDLFARFMTDQLAKAYGQPFVVDNRAGGSGVIATQVVTKSPPDGHTLLFTAASFSVVPAALNPQQPYDLLRDLVPIAQVAAGGQFLAVPADSRYKSVRDVLDAARAQPDRITYGTTGVGSVTHILMASILKQAGLRMAHVPYKSGAEVLRDLIGGVLPVGWVDTTNGGPAARGGRVRLLGVTGTFRVPGNPEVPTLAEQGHGADLNGWLAMFSAAGTPEPVVRSLNAELNKTMASEEARTRLSAMNVASFPANTPEQFAQTLRNDLAEWRRIVVENEIRVE